MQPAREGGAATCSIMQPAREGGTVQAEAEDEQHTDEDEQRRRTFSREEWLHLDVRLHNTKGGVVASGIVRNNRPTEYIDQEQLEPHNVDILIIESMMTDIIPNECKWTLKWWPCRLSFHKTTLLYDLGKAFEEDLRSRNKGIRQSTGKQYKTTRCGCVHQGSKLEKLLSDEALWRVTRATCYGRNCTQKTHRDVVKSMRHEFWSAEHQMRTHMKLDIHRQVDCGLGQKYVMMHNETICLKAWRIIMGISKTEFYRQRADAVARVTSKKHGNVGLKKRRLATRQAMATLGCIIDRIADIMLHRYRPGPNGEKLVERVLPAGSKWIDINEKVNEVNAALGLALVSPSTINFLLWSQVWRVHN